MMRKEYDIKKLKVKRRGVLPALARYRQRDIEALKKKLLSDVSFIRELAKKVEQINNF